MIYDGGFRNPKSESSLSFRLKFLDIVKYSVFNNKDIGNQIFHVRYWLLNKIEIVLIFSTMMKFINWLKIQFLRCFERESFPQLIATFNFVLETSHDIFVTLFD